MKKQTRQKGFTLIELLVVISIIGLLSGIVLVSTQGMRAKARDARRLADMNEVQKAIRMYFDKYGQLPATTPDSCCDLWDQGPCAAEPDNAFIDALRTSQIMGSVPFDPAGKPTGFADNDCYGYGYYLYEAGEFGCDANRGAFYVLGVRDMETSEGIYPGSPGFSCAGRNWQAGPPGLPEFEWVTGGFEKDY